MIILEYQDINYKENIYRCPKKVGIIQKIHKKDNIVDLDSFKTNEKLTINLDDVILFTPNSIYDIIRYHIYNYKKN